MSLYICKGEMLRYLRPNPASSPPRCAERHKRCSGVDRSCTSTLLLIRESTIWIAKTSPQTRLPGFLSCCYIYIFTADLSKTLTSAVTYKKKWNHWVLREPCALVTTVQSVNQGAVGIQAKTQHTALESLFVLCFMSCFHFSVHHTRLVTRQNQCSSLMGSEFKAIILSMWRIPRTLPGKCALCVLFLLFFVCVCPGHFSAGGPYVQYISMVCPH